MASEAVENITLAVFLHDCQIAVHDSNNDISGGSPARWHVPRIEAKGLTKHFKEVLAVDGLDLTVPAGTVFSLLGPNGSGKTTTVRCSRPCSGLTVATPT